MRRETLIAPFDASTRIFAAVRSIDRIAANATDGRKIDFRHGRIDASARSTARIAAKERIEMLTITILFARTVDRLLVMNLKVERFVRSGEINQLSLTIERFARAQGDFS